MYIASANSSTNAMNPPSAASGTASRSCASVPPAAVSIIASTPTNRPARENTRRHDFIEVRSFSLLRDVVLGIPGIGSRCVSGERRRTRFCDSPAPETQIVALTRGTIPSRVVCKFGQRFTFPGAVEVREDAVDDAVAAFQVGEAGHGAGAFSHFAESAFDDVGGADFFPVRFRDLEEIQ